MAEMAKDAMEAEENRVRLEELHREVQREAKRREASLLEALRIAEMDVNATRAELSESRQREARLVSRLAEAGLPEEDSDDSDSIEADNAEDSMSPIRSG